MDESKKADWLASRKKQRSDRNAPELFARIVAQDNSALSAAITLLESTLPEDQQAARELIRLCLPHTGKSIRIGITGVPGVGKSSFIEEFGQHILTQQKRIAILAIDPSSERTGGSILGDKTRMQHLSVAPNVFIRPSAAGSTLGGVARKTRETIILCEAAGYDVILIETVGVGQSETMVHSMVDFFLLLLLAGAGDELQGIKRGIMEMADGLAVTKSDGDNVQRTKLAVAELKNAIHLFPPTASNWIPPVLTCSSMEKKGIDTIWDEINKYQRHTTTSGFFQKKRTEQDHFWLHETLKELLIAGLTTNQKVQSELPQLEALVHDGKLSAFDAAEKLYAYYSSTIQ